MWHMLRGTLRRLFRVGAMRQVSLVNFALTPPPLWGVTGNMRVDLTYRRCAPGSCSMWVV